MNAGNYIRAGQGPKGENTYLADVVRVEGIAINERRTLGNNEQRLAVRADSEVANSGRARTGVIARLLAAHIAPASAEDFQAPGKSPNHSSIHATKVAR